MRVAFILTPTFPAGFSTTAATTTTTTIRQRIKYAPSALILINLGHLKWWPSGPDETLSY